MSSGKYESYFRLLAYISLIVMPSIFSSCSFGTRREEMTIVRIIYEAGFEKNYKGFKKDRFLPFLFTSSLSVSDATTMGSDSGHSERLISGRILEFGGFNSDRLKTRNIIRIDCDGEYTGWFLLEKAHFSSVKGGDAILIRLQQGGNISVEAVGDSSERDGDGTF